MKKLTLKNKTVTISAEIQDEADLETALYIVEGMIRSLGYCFNGHVEIVEEDEELDPDPSVHD